MLKKYGEITILKKRIYLNNGKYENKIIEKIELKR